MFLATAVSATGELPQNSNQKVAGQCSRRSFTQASSRAAQRRKPGCRRFRSVRTTPQKLNSKSGEGNARERIKARAQPSPFLRTDERRPAELKISILDMKFDR